MHLRMPSIDRGSRASSGPLSSSFPLLRDARDPDLEGHGVRVSLVLSFLIFLFVRTRGDGPVNGPERGLGDWAGNYGRSRRGCSAASARARTERLLEPPWRAAGGPRLPEREAIAQQMQVRGTRVHGLVVDGFHTPRIGRGVPRRSSLPGGNGLWKLTHRGGVASRRTSRRRAPRGTRRSSERVLREHVRRDPHVRIR